MLETLIKHRDVTGVLLHFTAGQVDRMIRALSDDQRRFALLLAETIKQPHEIWQRWVRAPEDSQNWCLIRYYLQFLRVENEVGKEENISLVMQFTFLGRWQLSSAGVVFGDAEEVNTEARQGSLEYSNWQH